MLSFTAVIKIPVSSLRKENFYNERDRGKWNNTTFLYLPISKNFDCITTKLLDGIILSKNLICDIISVNHLAK